MPRFTPNLSLLKVNLSDSLRYIFEEIAKILNNVSDDNISPNAKIDHRKIDFTGFTFRNIGGDIQIGSNNFIYMGDSLTDGTWRIARSGNDLVFQRRESSAWVTKSTISA